MKKLTVAMFALVAAVNMIFAAESVVLRYVIILGLDSYEWQYTLSADGKATVVAAPRTINGRLEVPSHFGAEHPVVGIAPVAFGGRGDIEELILPEGLVEIGYGAFQNCTNLTVLTIPDSVQTMGSGVFGGCTSLEKLTIPFVGTTRGLDSSSPNYSAVRAQFGYMFDFVLGYDGAWRDGCRPVRSYITYPRVYSNGRWTDEYTYYIPTGLKEVVVTDDTLVSRYAFYGCEDLKRITFMGGVTNVQEAAFKNCTSLETVTFPEGLESIGDYAFQNCRNLQSETLAALPSGVESIGGGEFSGCDLGLTEITMPDSVTNVGYYAFQNCSNVVAATLSQCLTSIGYSAFQNCVGLTELTVPDSVLSMGSGVFGGCVSLEKLTIPFVGTMRGMDSSSPNYSAVRAQFGYMFDFVLGYDGAWRDGCRPVRSYITYPRVYSNGRWTDEYTYYIPTGLKEVVVTDDTLVSRYAFYGCEDLKRITFMGGVTNVQEAAFKNCTGLESIVFFGNAPSVGYDILAGVDSSCRLEVLPMSSGWGVDIPGTWNGIVVVYMADALLPAVADDAAVAAAMSGFADAKVVGNVKTLEQYDAFRSWAYAAKLPNGALGGSQAAKEAPYAWQSFAFGADKLIGKEITSSDVHVAALEVAGDGDRGALQFALEVAIDGVNIGGGSVPEAMLKENLKEVLGIEGATSLSADSFSSDNVEIAFDAPENGKARFTVTPPADVDRSFFMRVKVK